MEKRFEVTLFDFNDYGIYDNKTKGRTANHFNGKKLKEMEEYCEMLNNIYKKRY